MKTLLAYFQGKFNTCGFEKLPTGKYKMTLLDTVNSLTGQVIIELDEKNVLVDYADDQPMLPTGVSPPPLPPTEPEPTPPS